MWQGCSGWLAWLDNDKFLVGVPSKVMVVIVVWDVWLKAGLGGKGGWAG